ncbi:hypothetical protein CC79DRAFT_3043 [Sarocladium strictum]
MVVTLLPRGGGGLPFLTFPAAGCEVGAEFLGLPWPLRLGWVYPPIFLVCMGFCSLDVKFTQKPGRVKNEIGISSGRVRPDGRAVPESQSLGFGLCSVMFSIHHRVDLLPERAVRREKCHLPASPLFASTCLATPEKLGEFIPGLEMHGEREEGSGICALAFVRASKGEERPGVAHSRSLYDGYGACKTCIGGGDSSYLSLWGSLSQ